MNVIIKRFWQQINKFCKEIDNKRRLQIFICNINCWTIGCDKREYVITWQLVSMTPADGVKRLIKKQGDPEQVCQPFNLHQHQYKPVMLHITLFCGFDVFLLESRDAIFI